MEPFLLYFLRLLTDRRTFRGLDEREDAWLFHVRADGVSSMTPLTHAAVATVIYQKLRRVEWGWAIAFPLGFASHYILDAIPHFEKTGPLGNPQEPLGIILVLGLIGAGLALLLMRWNRDAGRIWLVLFLWIGVARYSFSLWRILTATLGLAYVAWKTKERSAVGCVLAGMLAVAPDLMPASFTLMTKLHDHVHYHIDWATRIHSMFSHQPIPENWRVQLHDPYLFLGYTLEMLVEGLIFLGALILFFGENSAWKTKSRKAGEIIAALETSEKS